MGAVRLWIAAASAFHAGPVQAETVADWRPYIVEASSRFGVPTSWIERVMQAESGGRTMLDQRPIRSSAGAMGLMQLMPGTWADMRARLGLGDNPDDPRDNILAGTLYLRLMYDRFGYPGLFAAYNAGPGRYADYLAGHARLPAETAAYLARVAPPPSGRVAVPTRSAIAVRGAQECAPGRSGD
ncbi:lytic transglycosylase domain-containing protein [Sphingomonas parapaucimobilis]|uniref:Putative lytic transglycosylase n=1 Tax=Sphingomonas parapaucimobilis NBRC 15100 TaxID=1219049 RepID=A0A0A1W615_9SPHN|nr:lytic transglycosylase domain-containing protein [Sphingomonas parapaucimobilis]GAM00314.1 putative lytic transglycosylase [Sphingomonas parapaucimobilis NBRC 15100]